MRSSVIILVSLFMLENSHAGAQTRRTTPGVISYSNPILHADYSDPDAIRVGDDYYMIASSFNQVPGIPILHSKDLVNWKLIGHALKKLVPENYYDTVRHGGGVWAPAIRYHNKEFVIYYPDPDFGIYVIRAKNITGPWSDPQLVIAGKGLIDPCPLWDTDGKAYLVHAYAGSRAGFKSIIVVREMNAEGTRIITDPVIVYDGHEKDNTIEGPKFYKRNGYYYIFAPAGGVSTGWQTVLRSKHIYGPYERRVVMSQGTTFINGPHQGAWVDSKTGEHWFLHFQDKKAYGRIVHLQPLQWKNDWPVIGKDADGDGTGEPVIDFQISKTKIKSAYPSPLVNHEFSRPGLNLQWQWQANPKEGWAFPTSAGRLVMFSQYWNDTEENYWNLPSLLAQKLPAEHFTATVKLNAELKITGEKIGLILFGADYGYISLQKKQNGLAIIVKENRGADRKGKDSTISEMPFSGTDLYLRITMENEGHYYFSWSKDDAAYTKVDHIFTAKPGRWVGAKCGLFITRPVLTNDAGYADIDWFMFTN